MSRTTQPILIVEDSPEDYEAASRAMGKAGVASPIFHVSRGEEALDFLLHQNGYANLEAFPRPGVILLDLNGPGPDGIQILNEIKRNASLREIPVIVLTASTDERDIQKFYDAGANGHISKPVDCDGFTNAMQKINEQVYEADLLPLQE